MSDGLISLSEQELLQLHRGEILEKATVDGGTTVNIRMMTSVGLPHTKVMELARQRGFRKSSDAKPLGAAAPSTPQVRMPVIPDSNPAVMPVGQRAATIGPMVTIDKASFSLAGGGAPHKSIAPDTASVVAGTPPAPAPSTKLPAVPPASSTGVVVDDSDSW